MAKNWDGDGYLIMFREAGTGRAVANVALRLEKNGTSAFRNLSHFMVFTLLSLVQ
jgi:hypothetical protein